MHRTAQVRLPGPDRIRYSLLAVLGVSVLGAVVGTRSWPVVGDAALIRYVVFLLRTGATPYRQIVDINLPGTYLFEAAAMRLFGGGAFGLRCYDGSLMLGITLACLVFTGRRHWFAGLFAGMFFALIHLQDGVAQQGQRDLILAALLALALAALQRLLRATRPPLLSALAFGLALGLSFTIKPVLLPAALLLLSFACVRSSTPRSPAVLSMAIFGLLLPGALVLGWLKRAGALQPFLRISCSLIPLHATLGRKSLLFLLVHSWSPLGILLICAFGLLYLGQRLSLDHELLLTVSTAGALLAYLVQAKGYPYQRYPFLLVLLLATGLLLDGALETVGGPQLLAAGMACWAAGLGIFFAWRASRYEPRTPTVTALSQQLSALGPVAELEGQVQCLDTFGGCINTLYNLKLRQSTGYLYDCYLFTAPGAERTAYREAFWTAFQQARPRWIVLSSQNCFSDLTNGSSRLASWPALQSELQQHYREVNHWTPNGTVAWFSHRQTPSGFKLLQRNDSP